MTARVAKYGNVYALLTIIHDLDEQPTITIAHISESRFRMTSHTQGFDASSSPQTSVWGSSYRAECFDHSEDTGSSAESFFSIETRTSGKVRPRVILKWFHDLGTLKATYEAAVELFKSRTGDLYPVEITEEHFEETFRAAKFERLSGDERDFLWLKEMKIATPKDF